MTVAQDVSSMWDDDEVEAPSEPTEAAESKSRRRGRRSNSMLSVARTTVRLTKAPADDLEALSRLLGCEADPATIAVASLSVDPQAATDQLTGLQALDPVELTVSCIALAEDRDKTKALWDMVASVSDSLPPRVPSAQVKAGAALARAITGLSAADIEALSAPVRWLSEK